MILKPITSDSYELYADNHVLSSLRKCEAYFTESIVNCSVTKYRSWPLEFGQYFHEVLELYYQAQKDETFELSKWLSQANTLWLKYDLEYFANFKQYKVLGGRFGAITLFTEYYQVHGNKQEILKTVGLEVAFGLNKEVFLGSVFLHSQTTTIQIDCYLTGRLDRIVDDGKFIYHLDNKTTGYFSGNEASNFKPHDGMLGYVFAVREIMKLLYPSLAEEGRLCNKIII